MTLDDIAVNKDNYLSHHGKKGMKWGIRLYQNKDGSLTALGYARRRHSINKMEKMEEKQKKYADKKGLSREFNAKRTGRNPVQVNIDGNGYGGSGRKTKGFENATDAYKHRSDMSTEELRDAYNRLNIEYGIKRLSDGDVQKKASNGEKFLKNLDYAAKVANNVGSIANSVGNVYSTYKKITGGGGDSNNNDKNKNNDELIKNLAGFLDDYDTSKKKKKKKGK